METLRLVRGVPTPAVPARVNHHGHGGGAPAHVCAAVGSRAGGGASAVEAVQAPAPAPASYVVQRPVRRLWPSSEEEAVEVEEEEVLPERRKGNWVMKILKVRSLWAEEEKKGLEMGDRCLGCGGDGESGGCVVAEEAEEEEEEEKTAVFDRDSFSRLLRRVSLKEAQVFSRMSYLGSLAYDIPKIKPVNLLKYHGLRFVTSSLEKKAKPLNAEKEQAPVKDREQNEEGSSGAEKVENQRREGYGITPSAAYQIAASAASYLQSQTKGILPFTAADKENLNDSTRGDGGNGMGAEVSSSEVASFVATTSSVTAVVAGKEEMKQAVAKGLNSVHSSPCEWYICDDDKSGARYFVIQGSETIASWQANLLFEPVQFEGFDVLVHRGIYEAAKGIYDQMLPQVRAHLKSHGSSATFRFTGHSLGGSLSLLISLMLLIRGEVPSSSLLPVISFGAPCIFCGGDYLLQKLGLPQTHVQAISMHRDIVPRAFSCSYPDHVAEILKAVNGNFRNHPCLKSQKLLYAPMGKLLILQPEEKFSPHHHLLPSGSGLYLLGNSKVSVKLLQAAQSAFLNSPHPLEMLSDRAAYGSEGTVSRDHDMSAYLRAMQAVVRQELKQMRRVKREQRRRIWWPLVASQSVRVDAITSHQGVLNDNYSQQHFTFSGILNGGKETLKRFQRLVASQHLHMVLVLFFPARWLLLGTLAVVNFR